MKSSPGVASSSAAPAARKPSSYQNLNLNQFHKPPPTAIGAPKQISSSKGNLLVFSRVDAKKSASIPRAGIAAAPTPMNIPSLKAESGGKDVTTNLVPLGGSGVWSSSTGGTAAAVVPGVSSAPLDASSSTSSTTASASAGVDGSARLPTKVVPWASRSQGSESSTAPALSQAPPSSSSSAGPGTAAAPRSFGSIKMRSWADDESDEERGPGTVAEKPLGPPPADLGEGPSKERSDAPRSGDTSGYGSDQQPPPRFGRATQGGADSTNLSGPSSSAFSVSSASSWRRGPQDSEGVGSGYYGYGREAEHDNQREPYYGRGGGMREEESYRGYSNDARASTAGRFGSVGQGVTSSSSGAFGRGPVNRGDIRAGRSDSFGGPSSALASDWTSRPGMGAPSSSLSGLPSRVPPALGVSNTAIEQQHALEMARMERELLESRKQQEREREERLAAERMRQQEAQQRHGFKHQRSGPDGYHGGHPGRLSEETRGWREERDSASTGLADSSASWRRSGADKERHFRDDQSPRSRGPSESEGITTGRSLTSGGSVAIAQGSVHLMQRQPLPAQSVSTQSAAQQSLSSISGSDLRTHDTERVKGDAVAQPRQQLLYDPKTRNFVPDTHQHQQGRVGGQRRSEESTEPVSRSKVVIKEKDKKPSNPAPSLSPEEEAIRSKEAQARARREARAKERAARPPRTNGLLFRYSDEHHTVDLIERVYTTGEMAEKDLSEGLGAASEGKDSTKISSGHTKEAPDADVSKASSEKNFPQSQPSKLSIAPSPSTALPATPAWSTPRETLAVVAGNVVDKVQKPAPESNSTSKASKAPTETPAVASAGGNVKVQSPATVETVENVESITSAEAAPSAAPQPASKVVSTESIIPQTPKPSAAAPTISVDAASPLDIQSFAESLQPSNSTQFQVFVPGKGLQSDVGMNRMQVSIPVQMQPLPQHQHQPQQQQHMDVMNNWAIGNQSRMAYGMYSAPGVLPSQFIQQTNNPQMFQQRQGQQMRAFDGGYGGNGMMPGNMMEVPMAPATMSWNAQPIAQINQMGGGFQPNNMIRNPASIGWISQSQQPIHLQQQQLRQQQPQEFFILDPSAAYGYQVAQQDRFVAANGSDIGINKMRPNPSSSRLHTWSSSGGGMDHMQVRGIAPGMSFVSTQPVLPFHAPTSAPVVFDSYSQIVPVPPQPPVNAIGSSANGGSGLNDVMTKSLAAPSGTGDIFKPPPPPALPTQPFEVPTAGKMQTAISNSGLVHSTRADGSVGPAPPAFAATSAPGSIRTDLDAGSSFTTESFAPVVSPNASHGKLNDYSDFEEQIVLHNKDIIADGSSPELKKGKPFGALEGRAGSHPGDRSHRSGGRGAPGGDAAHQRYDAKSGKSSIAQVLNHSAANKEADNTIFSAPVIVDQRVAQTGGNASKPITKNNGVTKPAGDNESYVSSRRRRPGSIRDDEAVSAERTPTAHASEEGKSPGPHQKKGIAPGKGSSSSSGGGGGGRARQPARGPPAVPK